LENLVRIELITLNDKKRGTGLKKTAQIGEKIVGLGSLGFEQNKKRGHCRGGGRGKIISSRKILAALSGRSN